MSRSSWGVRARATGHPPSRSSHGGVGGGGGGGGNRPNLRAVTLRTGPSRYGLAITPAALAPHTAAGVGATKVRSVNPMLRPVHPAAVVGSPTRSRTSNGAGNGAAVTPNGRVRLPRAQVSGAIP